MQVYAGMKRKAEEAAAMFENEQEEEAQQYSPQEHSQPSEVVTAIKSTKYASRLLVLVNNLEEIAVHLNSCNPETIASDYCDALSTYANVFLENDYRIIPTHALDFDLDDEEEEQQQHPKTKTLKAAFLEVEEAFDVLLDKLDKIVPKDVASENLVLVLKMKIKIKDLKTNIKDHVSALKSGKFFLSLDKVWQSVEVGTHGIEIECNSFNRKHHVSTILKGDKQDERYKDTAEGAVEEDYEVAANCVASKDSSQKQREYKLDIFGCPEAGIDSAHLMPQSLKCSGRWFPIVPWILNLSKEQQEITWSVRQKCIHGFLNPKDGAKETKARNVGIKHFPTNRVYLKGQALYFDRSPCFLIVPAMEIEKVMNWSGDGYSAIVLAGDKEDCTITKAKKVYYNVGACNGGYEGEFLATKTDVSMARQLLENALRCLAKSCQYLSKNEHFVKEAKKDLQHWIGKDANIFFSDLTSDSEKIKFPGQVDLEQIDSNFVRVRKVSFAGRSESQLTKTDSGLGPNSLHPAPDPMLLLLNSASNWLRRQKLDLLPACGPLGEDGDSDDDSSNFTATYSQECAARGWEMPNKVPENACIGVTNTSFDEASLTDECD